MRIEDLRIARYRSLFDVSLRPRQFTVLVGANNSGKTNFVDAVDFLADTYRYGLEIAVSRKGGLENIAHRKQRRTKSPLSFQLEATVTPGELVRFPGSANAAWYKRLLRITHHFEIEAKSQAIEAAFAVRRETITVARTGDDGPDEPLLRVERTLNEVELKYAATALRKAARGNEKAFLSELLFTFTDRDLMSLFAQGKGLESTELLVGARAYNFVLAAFARIAGNGTRIFQLSPLESRRPGVPTPNPDLERYGANLPAFVAQMKKGSPDLWDQVLQMMRRLVPGLEEIRTDFTPDRRLTLQFVEQGSGRPWSVDEISDGTIQALALFTALFDTRSRFVLIEEPENSVHPWIVRNFVDACRAATDKQVIVTTHSPALINCLVPEEVAVVSRTHGETQIRGLTDLDPDAMRLWSEGKISTFEIVDSGWVVDAVPGGPS